MDETTTVDVVTVDDGAAVPDAVAVETLIEDVSIDGMCGVY